MVAAVGIVLVLLSWWCCWSDALLKWKTICCCGNSSKNCSNRNEICAYYAYQFNEKKLNSEGKCITFFFSHETQKNKKIVRFFSFLNKSLNHHKNIVCFWWFFSHSRVSAFILIAYFFVCVECFWKKRENIHRFNGCGWQ